LNIEIPSASKNSVMIDYGTREKQAINNFLRFELSMILAPTRERTLNPYEIMGVPNNFLVLQYLDQVFKILVYALSLFLDA
jgi:hypothetical protein